MAAGTKDDPWQLKTAPGTSDYLVWKDETADPPALVCQVGGTQLRYHLRSIDDLHAWLKAEGGWVPLGGADEQKPAPTAPSRRGGVPSRTRSAAGTGSRRGCAGGSACTCRRCSRSWGSPS